MPDAFVSARIATYSDGPAVSPLFTRSGAGSREQGEGRGEKVSIHGGLGSLGGFAPQSITPQYKVTASTKANYAFSSDAKPPRSTPAR